MFSVKDSLLTLLIAISFGLLVGLFTYSILSCEIQPHVNAPVTLEIKNMIVVGDQCVQVLKGVNKVEACSSTLVDPPICTFEATEECMLFLYEENNGICYVLDEYGCIEVFLE